MNHFPAPRPPAVSRNTLRGIFCATLAIVATLPTPKASAQTPANSPAAAPANPTAIQTGDWRHSYASFGAFTGIISETGEVLWKYPLGTRDGWVQPNGDILLTLSKGRDYPGGGVVLVNRENAVLFEFRGTQSEVNTSQLLSNGNILLTEAGANPRILEVDRSGKIVVEVPIQTTVTNHHMQSRMTRKLENGNYLVPQLLDRVVREYSPKGEVVWEYKTPDEPKECWPFTAIRIPNGNTIINLTHGNGVVEVNPKGEVVWRVSNADFPEAPFKDPCGAQWLPNGNVVITSYAARGDAVKLFEISKEKKIVWSLRDGKPHGLHEFQILTTDGKPLGEPIFK
jgi:outer membrane protein assembly factor BamB